MHPSALRNGQLFFRVYADSFGAGTIVEIGAQNVNGSLREVAPLHLQYVGVDFVAGPGVEVVLSDPYVLPFGDASVDVVVSSSCLEHSEMFWLLFLEVLRILKPHGLFYMNVPSNADYHRYPVDCWRFYPDSANALVTWGRCNGYKPVVLESFVSEKAGGIWNDCIAVFLKDEALASMHRSRILDVKDDYTNGRLFGAAELRRHRSEPQDQLGLLNKLKRWYWLRREPKTYAEIRNAKNVRKTPSRSGQP